MKHSFYKITLLLVPYGLEFQVFRLLNERSPSSSALRAAFILCLRAWAVDVQGPTVEEEHVAGDFISKKSFGREPTML